MSEDLARELASLRRAHVGVTAAVDQLTEALEHGPARRIVKALAVGTDAELAKARADAQFIPTVKRLAALHQARVEMARVGRTLIEYDA